MGKATSTCYWRLLHWTLSWSFFASLLPSGAAQCPELTVPSFCSLIFNGIDITTNQSSYTFNPPNDTVQFQCATGYQLVNVAADMVLNDPGTVCQDGNDWSLLDSNVVCRIYDCGPPTVTNGAAMATTDHLFGSEATYACNSGYSLEGSAVAVCTMQGWTGAPECEKDPVLTEQQIIIILGAGLGTISLILFLLMIPLCCYLCKMYARLSEANALEDEVAFVRSHGAFNQENPLVGMKEEDAAGNPLYLTPDEMNEFENKI